MFSLRYFCLLWAGLCLVSLPALAFWPFDDDGGIDYTIRFSGVDEPMQAWLEELGLDERPSSNPPHTPEELDGEASALAEKVRKALLAKGYMEAIVQGGVERGKEPPVVHVQVEQGARYPLAGLSMKWPQEPLADIDLTILHSKQGEPLDMENIRKDAVTLRDMIGKDRCLLSLSVTPKLQLFGARRNARLVFEVEHGARADFGKPRIQGNARVKDSVIERAVAWKQGECYQEAKIESTRGNLIDNQLFASVEVKAAQAPGADGQVPVDIRVKERAARSIAAGVEYSTDKGAGVYGKWEHRNLLGEAEKLTVNLTLAEREQGLKGIFRVPAFLQDAQVLVLSSSLRHESYDAYEALSFEGNAGLERRLSKHVKAGLGVGYTISETKDALTGTNNYALLSVPGFVEYDTRNDTMEPRKGVLARFSATPYSETIGDGGQFLKLLGTGQHYLSSDELLFKPTLASRLSVGAIYGGKNDRVPADIRYYAGGGGSVRGYSYRTLSPYFRDEPIGGSSLLEASGEVRMRFDETFGGVLFADAGNAYAAEVPDLSEPLYVGVGAGIRYYSPVGPLRLDVAVPVNSGDSGQTGYQIYVSLGQAF